jgi:hypothetical protein
MTFRTALNRAARNHVYAAGGGLLFAGTTIKLFWFSDATFVTAASDIYGDMALAVAGFIAVALGLKRWGDIEGQRMAMRGPGEGKPGEFD